MDQFAEQLSAATLTSAKAAQQSANAVNVLSFPGADPTGNTDSTAAFNAAFAALGSLGGIVKFYGWFLVSDLNIPNNVTVEGVSPSVGQAMPNSNYTPAYYPAALVLSGAHPIVLNNSSLIKNALIIEKNISPLGTYPLPFANATVAATAVGAFSGSAITFATSPSTIHDPSAQNLLILGFGTGLDGSAATGLNRPLFKRVYMDCTNGITIQKVFDIGRSINCECWPFTTANQGFGDAAITRTGTAFYTGPGSTWYLWDDCFSYGWQTGHDVNGVGDVRQVNCGADGPNTSQPGSGCLGFNYRGTISNAMAMFCVGTNQADAAIRIQTTPTNNISCVTIVGGRFHGASGAANTYIDIQSCTAYQISNCIFSDNSSVGHINVATNAPGSITNCTFANFGTLSIVGPYASVPELDNNQFTGTYSGTLPPSRAWGSSGGTAQDFMGANAVAGQALGVRGQYTGAGTTKLVEITDVNNTNGVNVKLTGNGSTTPSKTLRAHSGNLEILNSAYTSMIFALDDIGNMTFGGQITFGSVSQSLPAWTTTGAGITQSPATYTDTTSTGTVPSVRMNAFRAQTMAATNATTVSSFVGAYFANPIAGANMTATATWALAADSLTTSGDSTLGATLNTVNLNLASAATSSGNTKTVNIGTGSASGSTTNIAIGSTAGTSTTTLNGSTVAAGTIQTKQYTVAALPAAGTAGRRAHVSDFSGTPTYLGALTGGGSTKVPVFDNGTAWVVG